MPIKNWSTTASSNNSTSPYGFPEGMPPSALNDASRQVMADVRAWYEDAIWADLGLTPTRVSATQFTVPGDYTSQFEQYRALRFTGSSTTYGTITTSAYATGVTTVTIGTSVIPATLTTVSLATVNAASRPGNLTDRAGTETITGSWTFSGTLVIPQASVTAHQAALALAASQTTSGTFGTARLGSGTANSGTYLRGDQTWASPPSAAWGAISGTLSSQTDLQNALNAKANSTHTHVTADITDLASYTGLDVRYYTEAEVTSLLAGKSNTGHTHVVADITDMASYLSAYTGFDARYYTETEVNSLLTGKSDTGHTHSYLPLSGGTLTGALVTASAGIELGHATDTTLTRVAAGRVAMEGVEIGYRAVPSLTYAATAATDSVGKCYAATAGVTVPSATFAAGDSFSIYNNSASAITITQGSSLTLRQVGTANTGNRTLAARGLATVWFVGANEAVITGGGLT